MFGVVNEGTIDRSLRVVVGVLLIGAALGVFGATWTTPWGWIGLVPLITGAVGTCPVYQLFGLSTCPRRS